MRTLKIGQYVILLTSSDLPSYHLKELPWFNQWWAQTIITLLSCMKTWSVYKINSRSLTFAVRPSCRHTDCTEKQMPIISSHGVSRVNGNPEVVFWLRRYFHFFFNYKCCKWHPSKTHTNMHFGIRFPI